VRAAHEGVASVHARTGAGTLPSLALGREEGERNAFRDRMRRGRHCTTQRKARRAKLGGPFGNGRRIAADCASSPRVAWPS
jgi:hypothetical protein